MSFIYDVQTIMNWGKVYLIEYAMGFCLFNSQFAAVHTD